MGGAASSSGKAPATTPAAAAGAGSPVPIGDSAASKGTALEVALFEAVSLPRPDVERVAALLEGGADPAWAQPLTLTMVTPAALAHRQAEWLLRAQAGVDDMGPPQLESGFALVREERPVADAVRTTALGVERVAVPPRRDGVGGWRRCVML